MAPLLDPTSLTPDTHIGRVLATYRRPSLADSEKSSTADDVR
jgi:hypothetical protein